MCNLRQYCRQRCVARLAATDGWTKPFNPERCKVATSTWPSLSGREHRNPIIPIAPTACVWKDNAQGARIRLPNATTTPARAQKQGLVKNQPLFIHHTFWHLLVEETNKLLASTRLLKLTYGLRLNLANTFAGHLKDMPHFFQGVAVAIPETISQFDDLAFAIAQ